MNRARAFFVLMRPHQWTKNLFVLAPLFFARGFDDPALIGRAVLAAFLFSIGASAVYALNDVVDRDRDRAHPQKRSRPVASGVIPVSVASVLALLLAAGALAGAAALHVDLLRVLAIYLVLNVAYSLVLKRWVLVDALTVAISFVLRVLGGAAAVDVPTTHWLLLCTLLLALFLSFSKRRAEIALLEGDFENHRPALVGYSTSLLDRFDAILSAAAIVSYALYSVAPETIAKFGTDRLIYGLPFVIYGLFRYMMLVERGRDAGEPGRLVLTDPPMVICLALWVGVNGLIIYSR